MGPNISRDERISSGSDPSTSDMTKVMSTRLNDCTSTDLIVLCKYYKFESSKVLHALKKHVDFNGACFEDLYEKSTSEEIEKERLKLVDVVDEFVKDRSESKFFVYKVVFKKFTHEKGSNSGSSNGSEIVDGPTTTTTSTFNRFNNGTSSGGGSALSQVDEIKDYTVVPIPDSQLSPEERKGIELVKKKFKEQSKKSFISGSKLPMSINSDNTTDLSNIEAQIFVCEDRFMHYYFIRPTEKKNTRIVDAPACLHVKLLVSPLKASTVEKKVMATFSDALEVNEYGIVHTGILIGEWKIDWYNSSLVHVSCDSDKKLDASNTIAAIDIGDIVGAENVKQAFKSITKIACNYNANKKYSLLNANCQHFVSDLLDALQLTIPDSLSFKIYFEKLKRGETDRTFYVNENLARSISTCGKSNSYIGLKSITFKSRIELDRFSHFLDEIKYFDSQDGENDFWLLKAFDRSFVLIGENENCITSDSTGGIKENGFFTTNGGRTEDSISKIKYSIKDVDFTDCNLKR